MELKRSFGKSISEYAIILTLIAVVAIPAIMFLGSTIDLGFKDSSSRHKAGTKSLNSLLTPEHWNDSGESATIPGIEITAIGEALPDTLEDLSGLGLDGSFILSDGTATTSAEGTTQLISDLLTEIATTGLFFDGTPLTGDEQVALQKLADKLDSLSKEQGQFLGDTSSSSKWDSVINKNNDSINIFNNEITVAFGSNSDGYQQVELLMSLVTNGSKQIKPSGGSSVNTLGDAKLNITDSKIPGFTKAASKNIATGKY